MKQLFLLLLPAFLLTQTSFNAQTGEKQASKSFAKKGDNFVNVYYGLSLTNAIIKGVAAVSATQVDFRAIGPLGLTYEHIVRDRVGLGLDMGYSSGTLTYADIYNDPAAGVSQEYLVSLKYSTYRIFARLSFHLLEEGQNDFYPFISSGYKRTDFVLNVGIPEARAGIKLPNFSSIGFRPGFGYRHFFNSAVGMNIELAMGTPFASAGVSFKFR